MPEQNSITFRDQTTGKINDLLIDEHEACASSQNLLGFLAGALLNYRDEGIEFTPEIVICDCLQDFLKSFPGSVSHQIGISSLDPASGAKVLKDCGPLTSINWFIYIERTVDKNIKYGVFTYFRLPTAIPLHEGISISGDVFCVLIRKTNANTIEIKGAKGSSLTLIFSTIRDATTQNVSIDAFAEMCCSNISRSVPDKTFEIYFSRLLERALGSCHGTILVCTGTTPISEIEELKDAISIYPNLDFLSAFAQFQTTNTAESILNLQRCEDLLFGFLKCDGMIAFDTEGRVVAYRVFFKQSAERSGTTSIVVGGARRRAFEGVKGLVGRNLLSALFRSQDGLTLHHGVKADG